MPCSDDERDGAIYRWQLNPARIVAQPVRLLDGREQPGIPLWDDHFLETADVADALERSDQKRAAKLIQEQLDDERLSEQAVKRPLSYVAANLVSGLEGAQFTIWWNDREQRLETGIFCPKQRTAAYASLLREGLVPFPVGRCKECAKPFLQDARQEKEYCSGRCRNTRNVRRSRVRARAKSRTRKRKAGRTR